MCVSGIFVCLENDSRELFFDTKNWILKSPTLSITLTGLESFVQPVTSRIFKGNDNISYQLDIQCFKTAHPTVAPTVSPIKSPTLLPTLSPTLPPTKQPTKTPIELVVLINDDFIILQKQQYCEDSNDQVFKLQLTEFKDCVSKCMSDTRCRYFAFWNEKNNPHCTGWATCTPKTYVINTNPN